MKKKSNVITSVNLIIPETESRFPPRSGLPLARYSKICSSPLLWRSSPDCERRGGKAWSSSSSSSPSSSPSSWKGLPPLRQGLTLATGERSGSVGGERKQVVRLLLRSVAGNSSVIRHDAPMPVGLPRGQLALAYGVARACYFAVAGISFSSYPFGCGLSLGTLTPVHTHPFLPTFIAFFKF